MAGWTGLEPAAFRVTGGRYNQLNYHPATFWKVFYSQDAPVVQQQFLIFHGKSRQCRNFEHLRSNRPLENEIPEV